MLEKVKAIHERMMYLMHGETKLIKSIGRHAIDLDFGKDSDIFGMVNLVIEEYPDIHTNPYLEKKKEMIALVIDLHSIVQQTNSHIEQRNVLDNYIRRSFFGNEGAVDNILNYNLINDLGIDDTELSGSGFLEGDFAE